MIKPTRSGRTGYHFHDCLMVPPVRNIDSYKKTEPAQSIKVLHSRMGVPG